MDFFSDELVADLKGTFEKNGGTLNPFFLITSPTVKMLVPSDTASEEEKRVLVKLILALCAATDAENYYTVSDIHYVEAPITGGVRREDYADYLGDDPRSHEALHILYISHDDRASLLLPYTREGDRIVWADEKISLQSGAEIVGRFAECLPRRDVEPMPQFLRDMMRPYIDMFALPPEA